MKLQGGTDSKKLAYQNSNDFGVVQAMRQLLCSSLTVRGMLLQAAISSGLDSIEVVQQASREHLLAERRRRATKQAKRGGAPPRATDMQPPPRVLPDMNLPTAATQAGKAARRRPKGASFAQPCS